MVTRQRKGTGTRRRTPKARPATTAVEVRPAPMAEMKARMETAGRHVKVAGNAARKFARSYVREVTTAAKASREPVQALVHNFRMAGRHIARDAREMWQEVVPVSMMESLKLPLLRRARRPAA